jgi:hypothetical protein
MRISRQDLLSGIIEAVYSKESKNDNGCFAVDSVLQVNGLPRCAQADVLRSGLAGS